MRLKLHATGCRKLKAVDGRPTEYRDTLVRGLVLRVRGRGAGTFSAVYWFGGRNRRVTLGRVGKTSLSAARALARQLFLEVVAGRDPATERRRARFARTTLPQTVDELVSRCFAALDLRPSTRAEWKRIAKVEISPVLGRRPAVELTRGEVRAWRDAIRGRSRNVAQTSMAVLRRVYRWALEEDLLASSPCAGLAVTVPRPRTSRWLRAGELRALWEALGRVAPGSPFPDVVRLLLLTAVRRGEALGARREEFHDLEGEDARWIIPGERMKAGLEHLVPLSRQAIEVVRRRLEAVTGSCLFPALDGDRSIRWPPRFAQLLHDETLGCLREDLDDPAAKLERWTIHCIRHTVATHMQDILKVPDAVIALVLAHRPPGLTDVDGIYLRGRRLDERREALQRWANWLVATAEGAKRGAAGGRSESSISVLPRRGSMRRFPAVAVVLSLAVLSLELTACGAGSSVTGPGSPQEPAAPPTPDPGPPNIVLVVADDMGWGDPSSYGNTQIRTPRIDSLATEGLRFTQAYTPAAICAASRAALLTGHTPSHNRVRWNPPKMMLESETLISEVLHEIGYSTGMAGKWHIEGYTPEERGFDWAEWTWNGSPVPNHNYASHYTYLALQWVDSQRASKRPFFLYLCHRDPHAPLAAPPEFSGRSPAGLYGDTVEWLDAQIGVLLDGLRAMELEQNTLVVFVSDNGPPKGIGFRGPLSGDKGSCLEGGIRIPTLVRWPARARGSRALQTPISTLDWFPTFVTLARGAQLLPDHRPDGVDLTSLLSGQADNLTGSGIGGARELLFWGPEGTCAVRSGRMKYLRPGFWYPHPQLLDLEADVGETHNLIREQPELAEQLARRLEDLESR